MEQPRFTSEEKMILREYDEEMEYITQQRQQLIRDEEFFGIEPDTPWISERQYQPREVGRE